MELGTAPLSRLGQLRAAFTARQLVTTLCYRSHEFSPDRIPTLVCGSYLGACEITVNSWDAFTWINGHGNRMYMDGSFPELVVDEVVRTRAGVTVTPVLPRRVRT